jgi:hypothetical protein
MKITIAWNVWNVYEDLLIGSEFIHFQNKEKNIFDKVNIISQGGYPEPPSPQQIQYLDRHYHIDYPEVPLLKAHVKFKGVFRVLEGIKNAFKVAVENQSDFLIVTNSDAWPLSLEKLNRLLIDIQKRNVDMACRVGEIAGLTINAGEKVPSFDDHFLIFDVNNCQKDNVFDYNSQVPFYHLKFGHVGGMHNLLFHFVNQRIPNGKLYFYSHLESAIGQYGDPVGWNLLPWQYETKTSFLHANCAQVPHLHKLRAQLLKDMAYDQYPEIKKYCNQHINSYPMRKITQKNGHSTFRRSLSRYLYDHLFFKIQKISQFLFLLTHYSQSKKNLRNYRKNNKIYPTNLLN